MTDGQSPDDRNGDLLAPAAARLTARYGRSVDADTIRTVLRETYDALLADATVTAFLPLLAERSAAARLARTGGGAGGVTPGPG